MLKNVLKKNNLELFLRFDLLGAKQTIHLVRMVGFLFKVINLKQCSGRVGGHVYSRLRAVVHLQLKCTVCSVHTKAWRL